MTTYTDLQIRTALLAAAETFEVKPGLFDYGEVKVPPCGSPGCVVGMIGFHLGMKMGTDISDVAHLLGFDDGSFHEHGMYNAFTEVYGCGWRDSPKEAAEMLRLYADAKFPVAQAAPTKALSTYVHQPTVSWADCLFQPAAFKEHAPVRPVSEVGL